MKILVIGDLHGRTRWHWPATKFLVENPTGTVLFLGDYVDSFHRTDQQMLASFELVLAFKREHGERCVLLLGNHDFPYLYYPPRPGSEYYSCSGFRPQLAAELHRLYKSQEANFQVAYQVQTPGRDYLFVHAGVSTMWLDEYEALLNAHELLSGTCQTLADVLNALLHTARGRNALWRVGRENGGMGALDGPLWVRPGQLSRGLINGYVQVVGHTPVPSVTWAVDGGQNTGCIMCDCLRDSKNEFLILNL